MTEQAANHDLGRLDRHRPAQLSPEVWSANLTALAEDQPALAKRLRQVSLPANWRPARALDGFITYRLEADGQPPEWLGGSAVPLIRARGLLANVELAGKNAALPFCREGAVLRVLLGRLPRNVAIFVFESEARVLAAVLRAQDFSADIASGRCVFLPPGREREAEALGKLLRKHPGLLPPSEIILPDLEPPRRSGELQTTGGRVGQEIGRERAAQLQSLDAAGGKARPLPAEPRVAILSLSQQTRAHTRAAELERAARELGWQAMRRVVVGPRDVHPLVHCRALAEFDPDLTLCVNHLPSALPVSPWGRTCVWLIEDPGAADQLAGQDTLFLGASPRIVAALSAAGLDSSAVFKWYWACESKVLAPAPASAPAEPVVLLVADLPDRRPEACRIEQATHQVLWERLAANAVRIWETHQIQNVEGLLTRTERECQVELTDAALRESMRRLIRLVLVPAIMLESIARVLEDEPLTVRTIGRGWDRIGTRNLKPLAAELSELPGPGGGLRPCACIFAGQGDPLSAALLHAAGRRWPLLIHQPPGQSAGAGLGKVLVPERHFASFRTLAELRGAVLALLRTPEAGRRRADSAFQHVADGHTYNKRWRDLVAHLRGG